MSRLVKERKRDLELINAYQYTLATHVDGDVGMEAVWSTLETPPESSALASVSRALGLSSKRTLKEETKEALLASDKLVKTRTHWVNYNVMKSLQPSLETDDRFDAASVISNVIRKFNLQRAEAGKKNSSAEEIMNREATNIERVWRGYLGLRAYKREKQKGFEDEKVWKSYEDFRKMLLGDGIAVSRWSHSKKIPVPCTIKIGFTPEKDPLLILTQSSFKPAKKYLLTDVHTVTKGFSSPFLRDLVVHKAPEKLLSLLLRDKLNSGSFFEVMTGKAVKDVSIDLTWDAPLNSAASVEGGATNDGKFARNKFFANFNKLLHEVESENAFFFNAQGVYCRVGKSVFHRWEQVTFIDPAWENEMDEDERRLRNKKKFASKSRLKKPKHKDRCFEPHPLALGGKPQDSLEFVYELAAGASGEDGQEVEYAATWFSWTEEIDYADKAATPNAAEALVCRAAAIKACGLSHEDARRLVPTKAEAQQQQRRRGDALIVLSPEDEVKAYRFAAALRKEECTIRKERFVLQQAKRVDGELQPVFLDKAAARKNAVSSENESEGEEDEERGPSPRGGPPPSSSSKKKNKKEALRLEPAVAPLEQLLPYFKVRVAKLYGDVGVAGWRNRESGDFELTEENWAKLCDVAQHAGKKSAHAADKLVKVTEKLAFHEAKLRAKETQGARKVDDEGARAQAEALARADALVVAEKEDLRARASHFTGFMSPTAAHFKRDRAFPFLEGEDLEDYLEEANTLEDEVGHEGKKVAKFKKKLVQCQKLLLQNMWEKKDQRAMRMWRAKDRSFNTSEKKKIETEKLQLAAAAAKRIADKEKELLAAAANAAGPSRGGARASGLSTQDTESLDGSATSGSRSMRSQASGSLSGFTTGGGLSSMLQSARDAYAGLGEDGGGDEPDDGLALKTRNEPPALDDGDGDADDNALREAAAKGDEQDYDEYEEEEYDDDDDDPVRDALGTASRSEGEGLELVVLEVSKKGKPRLPLGLDVVYFDLSAQPITAPKPAKKHKAVVSSKKRLKMYHNKGAAAMRKDLERITLPPDVDLSQITDALQLARLCVDHHTAIFKAATCMVSKGALVVRGTNGKASPSISSAYQNSVLCEDDYIVGVNGTIVADKDELIKLVSNSLKTRNLIVIRSTAEIPYHEFEGLEEFEI